MPKLRWTISGKSQGEQERGRSEAHQTSKPVPRKWRHGKLGRADELHSRSHLGKLPTGAVRRPLATPLRTEQQRGAQAAASLPPDNFVDLMQQANQRCRQQPERTPSATRKHKRGNPVF